MATLTEQEALQRDEELLAKVIAACWIEADVIENESPGTPGHQTRIRWADRLRNLNSNALPLQMLKAIVAANETETVATIEGFTDAEWLSELDDVVADFDV